MEQIPTSEPNNLWIVIGAYVIPTIISVGTFLWQMRKDKATIDKTGSDIQHQAHEGELEEGKLSLDIAKELRAENAELRSEVRTLRKEINDLSGKVRELELENTRLRLSLEHTRPRKDISDGNPTNS